MVMKVSGTAMIPDFHITEGGKIVKITQDNLESAVRNADIVTFVEDHIEDGNPSVKGIATDVYSVGYGIEYVTVLNDDNTEKRITDIYDSGKIPNVSCRLVPAVDAEVTIASNVDGNEYYSVDEWVLKHISLVDVARCKPEDGCGIFNYELLNSEKPIGDSMELKEATEKIAKLEETVSGMTLSLSELESKNAELKKSVDEYKTENSDMTLVLEETKTNILEYRKREIDTLKNDILKLDSEYDFGDKEDKESLELVLSNLRRTSTRRESNAGDNEDKNDSIEAIKELKIASGRLV